LFAAPSITLSGMDLMDSVRDGIIRAGREAARVRFMGEAQARLVTLRLTRRSRRDALTSEVLDLYRRNQIHQPTLLRFCQDLDAVENEIERIEAALSRARGTTESRPATPVITELPQQTPQP